MDTWRPPGGKHHWSDILAESESSFGQAFGRVAPMDFPAVSQVPLIDDCPTGKDVFFPICFSSYVLTSFSYWGLAQIMIYLPLCNSLGVPPWHPHQFLEKRSSRRQKTQLMDQGLLSHYALFCIPGEKRSTPTLWMIWIYLKMVYTTQMVL